MELIADFRPYWQSVRMLLPPMKPAVMAAVLSMLAACASVPPAQNMLAEPMISPWLRIRPCIGGPLRHDQVLVVFDIDNTLLAMEQGLGSDQWYDWQKTAK